MIRSLRGQRSPERTVESLYREYAPDIYRYALAVLGSRADAEDVTQATFLNAFRAIERGEQPRHPGAWLRAIAHNVCLQQFRQMSRRPQQVELDEDAGELVAEEEEAPTLEDLTRSLKQIPFNQRAALVMREFEGRPVAEIAGVLGVSAAAVETLLFRARRSLREQLEESLTCIEAERAISRQLDGLLPRHERGALRAHLRQCQACATHARRLRAQRSAMRSLAAVPLPAALAWSHIGAGAGTTATAGAASAASASAPAGLSVVAKLAAGALAAGALGGLGYAGYSQFRASPVRTATPARGHAARTFAPVGTPAAAASAPAVPAAHRARHRHRVTRHAPAQATRQQPPALVVPIPVRQPSTLSPAPVAAKPLRPAPRRGHKTPASTKPHGPGKNNPGNAQTRPTSPSKPHRTQPHKTQPNEPQPLAPSPPAPHGNGGGANSGKPGKGPPQG